MRLRDFLPLILSVMLVTVLIFGQETQPESKPEPRKFVTPTQRLQAAKSVFLKHDGSELPFDVIQGAFESWGRYIIVDSEEKADLIVDVSAPIESTGASTQTNVSIDNNRGQQKETKTSSHQLSDVTMIKVTVSDPRTKVALWSGIERPKNAWKEKNRQDSQVESARKLFTAFHDRVEPQDAAAESTPK
jgi:hypothetical protein